MGSFRHTRDDNIVINDTLIVPLSWFVTEEAAYALPVGYVGRHYTQTIEDVQQTATTEIRNTLPWADGDTYISNVATYTANYATFLATPSSLSAAKVTQKQLADTYAFSTALGNVQHTAVNYPSVQKDRLKDELYYFARIGQYDVTHLRYGF